MPHRIDRGDQFCLRRVPFLRRLACCARFASAACPGIPARLLDRFGAAQQVSRIDRVLLIELAHHAQHRIEVPGRPHRRRVLGAKLVEPRQVRQQQAVILAPPHRHHLAVVEHRLLHSVERPFGQHRLRVIARQNQRRPPSRCKGQVAPPRQVEP